MVQKVPGTSQLSLGQNTNSQRVENQTTEHNSNNEKNNTFKDSMYDYGKLEAQLTQLQEYTEWRIKLLEKEMEVHLKRILNKTLTEVSMNVANTVASQIMKAVQGMLHQLPSVHNRDHHLGKSPSKEDKHK